MTVSQARGIDGFARRRLFDLEFIDLPELEPLVERLASHEPQRGRGDRRPIVVTPNVDHLVKLDAGIDAVSAQVARSATHVLPDGQPVVWASRLLGAPLAARLPGSSLVDGLWPRLCADGRRAVVVASSHDIARRIESDNPHARAIVAPHISLSDRAALDQLVRQSAAICREIEASHVFVTLGFPKQCNVIDGILNELEKADAELPMCLAVGASFDMHYGFVPRAPEWMQRVGLEWFHRFLREPRRLFRRYFVDDLRFVGLVRRERRKISRAAAPHDVGPQVAVSPEG